MSRLALLVLAMCTGITGNAGPKADLSEDQRRIAADIAAALAPDTLFPDKYDAVVWQASTGRRLERFLVSADERAAIMRAVLAEGLRHGLDPDLLLAVIEVESGFDRFAVSHTGAQGLMQVMPFWKAALGRPNDNLMRVDTNVRYGAAILAHYLRASGGDLVGALSRYNGASGPAYADKVLSTWQRRWQSRSSTLLRRACDVYPLSACR